MRIVSPEVIQQEERSLLEGIKALFRIDSFKQHFTENYRLELSDLSSLDGGDIIVQNDRVVFAMGLSGKIAFSILIDRRGNYLAFDNSHQEGHEDGPGAEHRMMLSSPDTILQKEREIVNAIADGVDHNTVRSLFEKEFNFRLDGGTHFEGGTIAIFNSLPVYRLNYKSELNVNLLIDKAGSLIEFASPEGASRKMEAHH